MAETNVDLRPGKVALAGAALWLCCFQYFVAEQVARLAWTRPYSMATNYISDLGAVHCDPLGVGRSICSPLHPLMNASFVLQGCLIALGALLVRRLFPEGILASVGLIVIALSGVGVLMVGLAPEDVDIRKHILGALLHFYGGNGGILLLGFACLRPWRLRPGWALAAPLTLAAGAIGLAATLLYGARHNLGLGTGGMERVAAYPVTIWLTLMGLFLIVRARAAAAT